MRRSILFSLALLIMLPAMAPAQVTNLDTWIDTDFDGLPANAPVTMNVDMIDSFAIYVDLTGFPVANWTNFLYAVTFGPVGGDGSTNWFSTDTADVFLRTDATGNQLPENNFDLPYAVQFTGQGFNVPASANYRLGVVYVRPILASAPGAACITPLVDIYGPGYIFSQFGAGGDFGTFQQGIITQGCVTVSGGNATDATSWGKLKGLYR